MLVGLCGLEERTVLVRVGCYLLRLNVFKYFIYVIVFLFVYTYFFLERM